MAKLTEELQFIIDLELNDADVKKVIRSVDNVVRKTQQLVTTTKLSEEAQEEANQIFLAADKIYSKFNQTLDKSTKEYGSVVSKQNTLIRSSQQLALQQKGLGKATNNANQILFSFGDAIQDGAQFQFGFAQGARAIGNNLAFAAEQFALTNQRAGGFLSTLKVLGRSFLGPAGIIVGINAAITAVTLLSSKFDKQKKETNELNKSTEKTVNFFSDLLNVSRKLGLLAPDRGIFDIKALEFERDVIKDNLKDLRGISKRQETLNNLKQKENELTSQRQILGGSVNDEINEQLKSVRNQITVLEDFFEDNKDLLDLYREQNKLLKDREAQIIRLSDIESQAREQRSRTLEERRRLPSIGFATIDPIRTSTENLERDLTELTASGELSREQIRERAIQRYLRLLAERGEREEELEKRRQKAFKATQIGFNLVSNLIGAEIALIQSRDDKNEESARKAFEDSKKLAKSQAIVASASATARIFSDLGPVAGLIALPFFAKILQKQIKAINNTTFDGGGSSSASVNSGGSAPSSASSSRTESTFEAARTPSAFRQQPNFNVNFDTNFSAKGMAQTVRIGEQEIMSNTVTG
jgi:hypothetical protein